MSDRVDRMGANPAAGWRIDDVQAACREHDVACVSPRGGGSHFRVSHLRMREKLTIPYRRPIKPIYIRQLVAFWTP